MKSIINFFIFWFMILGLYSMMRWVLIKWRWWGSLGWKVKKPWN